MFTCVPNRCVLNEIGVCRPKEPSPSPKISVNSNPSSLKINKARMWRRGNVNSFSKEQAAEKNDGQRTQWATTTTTTITKVTTKRKKEEKKNTHTENKERKIR